jgi:hypothetical protein
MYGLIIACTIFKIFVLYEFVLDNICILIFLLF